MALSEYRRKEVTVLSTCFETGKTYTLKSKDGKSDLPIAPFAVVH
jgi:hypothetical protein